MTFESEPNTTPPWNIEPKESVGASSFSERLADLSRDCGPGVNQNDRAIVMITACIDAGITAAGQIIATLEPFGFKREHLGAVLTKSRGHHWQCESDGTYSLPSEGRSAAPVSAAHITVPAVATTAVPAPKR